MKFQYLKFRHLFKSKIEKLLGIKFWCKCPQGLDELVDINCTKYPIRTIFDVGANVGQSALRFKINFSAAAIHCFEPVADSFKLLKKNVQSENVRCHRIAVGDWCGRKKIYVTENRLTCSLIRPDDYVWEEECDMTTIDNFCVENKIDRIDYLKIDAEGNDLSVLEGSVNILSSGKLGFICIETGFHPEDNRHPLFDDVRNKLMKHGFRLFGIYGQQWEYSGEFSLRFANVVFAHKMTFGAG